MPWSFNRPRCSRAFHGNGHLIGWIAMLIAILISPVLTTFAGESRNALFRYVQSHWTFGLARRPDFQRDGA